MGTHELIVKYNSDTVEIDLGDNEILTLPFPTITLGINGEEFKRVPYPPDLLIALEGDLVGRSFSDLPLNRVAIVDWTVYSDHWDNEQWAILSWVIAQRGSSEERRCIEENIELLDNLRRIMEENLDVNNI